MTDSVVKLLMLKDLAKKINTARTEDDYIDCFKLAEAVLPSSASPDQPLFFVAPPTLKPRGEWHGLVADLPVADDALALMLASGFMPLDNLVVAHLSGGFDFGHLAEGEETPFCIDLDYGAILYKKLGRLRNYSLSTMALMRYFGEVPALEQYPSLYFALGAMRGRKAFLGRLEGNYDEVLHLEVSSRAELDTIVAKLRDYVDAQPAYELWFRGQNQDHLLPDLTALASGRICPWRSVRDTSLVPSLYRQLPKLLLNLPEYLALCYELAVASFFIESHLSIPPFSTRQVGEPADEKLDPKFLDHALRWTTTVTGGVSGDEVRDYHHTYRDLQRFFFLQHYGLPSNVLDITSDLDVALFFAQNSLQEGHCRPVDPEECNPILYMFLLNKDLDLYLDSAKLCEYYGLLRPLRQRCGLVSGASFGTRNNYARLLALKVSIRQPIKYAELSADYLMPGPDEDEFLASLLEYCGEHGFSRIRPFVLERTTA